MVWGHEVHNNINKHKHMAYTAWLNTNRKRVAMLLGLQNRWKPSPSLWTGYRCCLDYRTDGNLHHLYEQETDVVWTTEQMETFTISMNRRPMLFGLRNRWKTSPSLWTGERCCLDYRTDGNLHHIYEQETDVVWTTEQMEAFTISMNRRPMLFGLRNRCKPSPSLWTEDQFVAYIKPELLKKDVMCWALERTKGIQE